MLSEAGECRGIIIPSPMLGRNNATKTLVAVLKVRAFKETGKYKTWEHAVLPDI